MTVASSANTLCALLFHFSGARHSDPRKRQDLHQSAEAEGGGGAHQEARSRGGQSREGQERQGAEGEGQVDPLSNAARVLCVYVCVCVDMRGCDGFCALFLRRFLK